MAPAEGVDEKPGKRHEEEVGGVVAESEVFCCASWEAEELSAMLGVRDIS